MIHIDAMKDLRKLVLLASFVALSVVGAMIKIPSITGTVAFDSLSGYVAAVFIGPLAGAVVGGFGHLISAATVGFPFGILAHLIVAVTMIIAMGVFGILYKKNKIIAAIVAVIINGPIGIIPFGFLFGWAFCLALLPSLLLGSIVNVVIAIMVLRYLN